MLADRFSNNFLQLLNTNNVGKEGVRYNKGQEEKQYVLQANFKDFFPCQGSCFNFFCAPASPSTWYSILRNIISIKFV